MSTDNQNNSRRVFLIGTTLAMGGAGILGLAIPFVRAWNPSGRALAAGAPVTVDIRNIPENGMLVAEWRGKPIYILRRTQAILEALKEPNAELKDPDSEVDQQPTYARNEYRSVRPEILVLEGLCTHLGCTPKERPEPDADGFQGFLCPCHGAKFDFAGRVYEDVPAPSNLKVPPHFYKDDNLLVIGVDPEESPGSAEQVS